MKKQKLFNLLIAVISIVLITSCQLKRIEPPCPTITGLLPNAAGFDDTVVIKGTNFLPGLPSLYKVFIGGKSTSVLDVPDATTLRFKVPKGIGDGPVSISTGETICNSDNGQTFTYQLTITEIKLFASGFNSPAGMDIDGDGNVILADKSNHVIKQITPAPAAEISIIAGKNGMAGILDNDAGTAVNFNAPEDVAVDDGGNIYVADDLNNCIRKIANNSQHTVTTAAGAIGPPGDNDGIPPSSKFNRPRGIVVNGTNSVFVIEYTKARLRHISFSNNNVSTLLGGMATSALNFPIRVVYSENRNVQFPILIADRDNNRILETNINRTTNTPINIPFPPQDLAVDEAGNIIVLNKGGKRVSVVYKNNSIQDIAGWGINYDLKNPSGLAIDVKRKIIYISDEISNSVVMAKYD